MSVSEIFRKAYEELEKGYRIALITIIGKEGSGPRDLGSMILVSSSGLKIGTIGGGFFEKTVLEETRKALEEGRPRRVKYALRPDNVPEDAIKTPHLCGGVVEVFINVINPVPRIILFGAGNIGKPLADLANMLGYRVVVLDTNEELANKERYPYAEEIYVGDLVDYAGKISYRGNDIAIIAYGEVETDYQILKTLLQNNFPGHIWALCSRRRCSWMLNRLIEEKIDLCPYIEKLHLPAGLNINSDSPEEIAVSIFAEIICVLKKCETPVESMDISSKWWDSIKNRVEQP
ncbi:MAG: xanthine dehydrogenase [Desulfurococcales archaeon ex4484_58]|nr:MAG: xanthine dehydrogenase [Desulfurococcales archaeon ex4484_58]